MDDRRDERRQNTTTLIYRLQEDPRDEGRWSIVVERYRPRLAALCRKKGLAEQEIDAAVAEALAALFDLVRRGEFDRDRGKALTYAFRAAANAWRREMKKRAAESARQGDSQTACLIEQVADPADDLAEMIEQEQEQFLMQAAEQELIDGGAGRNLAMLKMSVVEERSTAEIAAAFDTTEAAVYMALSRVRRRLRIVVERLRAGFDQPRDTPREGNPP